jgi:hypothetical protein
LILFIVSLATNVKAPFWTICGRACILPGIREIREIRGQILKPRIRPDGTDKEKEIRGVMAQKAG